MIVRKRRRMVQRNRSLPPLYKIQMVMMMRVLKRCLTILILRIPAQALATVMTSSVLVVIVRYLVTEIQVVLLSQVIILR